MKAFSFLTVYPIQHTWDWPNLWLMTCLGISAACEVVVLNMLSLGVAGPPN
jgi:hypothetical protein